MMTAMASDRMTGVVQGTETGLRLRDLVRALAKGRLVVAVMSMLAVGACADDPDDELDDEPHDEPGFSYTDEPIRSLANTQDQPAPIDDRNELHAYVAQCEAVLGTIPEIRCDPADPAPGTTVTKIPVFVDGMLLGFGEDLSAREHELLAARAERGRYTCDFPSLGGDFPCSVGSTLVHHHDEDNPNVQWVALCRGVPWDNPNYDRFVDTGLIGSNSETGEMCFFFGHDGRDPEPDQAYQPYELPVLSSADPASTNLDPWLPPREMPGSCISCHPNNDPWILTPWLMPSYMGRILEQLEYPRQLPAGVDIDDVMAAREIQPTPKRLQLMLPNPLPAGRTSWTEEEIVNDRGLTVERQYRIVGSSYVSTEAEGTVQPRNDLRPASWGQGFRERIRLMPQSKSCSGCHAMGNEYWISLASDALGSQLPGAHRSDHLEQLLPEFHWMTPSRPYELAQVDADDFTVPAITECPIPKQVDDVPEVRLSCHPVEGHDGAVRITWEYVNDFGRVPGRDDVRFDVAFGAVAAVPPDLGSSATSEREGVLMDESAGVVVLRDLAPGESSSTYQLTLPFDQSQERLQIALQPKRFCFEEPDRRPFAYAPPYTVEVDVAAACR
jgi:hypothetical protein